MKGRQRQEAKQVVQPLNTMNRWWEGMKPYAGSFNLLAIATAQAEKLRQATIRRTSNSDCPACREKRLHGVSEWLYHPGAGHGIAQ